MNSLLPENIEHLSPRVKRLLRESLVTLDQLGRVDRAAENDLQVLFGNIIRHETNLAKRAAQGIKGAQHTTLHPCALI